MQRSTRRRSGWNFPARAALLLSLVGAIGLGLASDAAAIDPPTQPRKAAKHGPLNKGKPAVSRTALPKGAAPTPGAAPRDGAAHLHGGTAPGTGTALSKSNQPGSRSSPTRGPCQPSRDRAARRPARRIAQIAHARTAADPNRPPAIDPDRSQQIAAPAVSGRARLHRRAARRRDALRVQRDGLPGRRQRLAAGGRRAARRLGLTTVALAALRPHRRNPLPFPRRAGRPVADVVRAMEARAHRRRAAELRLHARSKTPRSAGAHGEAAAPSNTSSTSCGWREVHSSRPARNVLVAVIDSEIDAQASRSRRRHRRAVRRRRPARRAAFAWHRHGRRDRGACAADGHRARRAHPRRPCVQPGGRAIAAGDHQHILAGLEWAINKGARVINMSFAGPYDPMLQLAMKKAHEKGAC